MSNEISRIVLSQEDIDGIDAELMGDGSERMQARGRTISIEPGLGGHVRGIADEMVEKCDVIGLRALSLYLDELAQEVDDRIKVE
jgi:hypothetical protein